MFVWGVPVSVGEVLGDDVCCGLLLGLPLLLLGEDGWKVGEGGQGGRPPVTIVEST